jgi:hypothetical protein
MFKIVGTGSTNDDNIVYLFWDIIMMLHIVQL